EALAIDRLTRLLDATGRVEILGSNTSPSKAIRFLQSHAVDVLFLDISMPGMNGFDLLANLSDAPNVVFTTAHDEHALKAFEVNSVDYLLKPIERVQLERALSKVERLRGTSIANIKFDKLFETLAASLQRSDTDYPERIASRLGDRVCFVDLARVT